MVLGKLPVPGRPTIWMTVGQGPIVLAVGAGGGCLDIFTLLYPFSQKAVKPKTTNQSTQIYQCRFYIFSRFCACMYP